MSGQMPGFLSFLMSFASCIVLVKIVASWHLVVIETPSHEKSTTGQPEFSQFNFPKMSILSRLTNVFPSTKILKTAYLDIFPLRRKL